MRPLSTVRPKSADSGPPHQLECPLHPGLSTFFLGVGPCLVCRAFAPSYGYGLLPLRQRFVCRPVDPFFEPPDSGVPTPGASFRTDRFSPLGSSALSHPRRLAFANLRTRLPSPTNKPRSGLHGSCPDLAFQVTVSSPRPFRALQPSSSSATHSARSGNHPCPLSLLRPGLSCLTRARPQVLPVGWILPCRFFPLPPLHFRPSVVPPLPVRSPSASVPLPAFRFPASSSCSKGPDPPVLIQPFLSFFFQVPKNPSFSGDLS